MSEATTLALPVTHEIALHPHAHSHETTSTAAQSFAFAGQRWQSGLAQGASGTGLLGMGLFLLSQIGSTPALVTQLAILGAVCSVGGLALLTKSIGDLFGRLDIDETGIAVRPGLTGYAIAWSELDRWEVKLDSELHSEAHSIRFWTSGSPCALFIPNNWLTHQDRAEIRRTLLGYAADKASHPSRAVGQ